MNRVVFQNEGYSFKGVFESFDEDSRHNLLFNYAAKDLSKLPALLEQHINKKMDILTFEQNNYQYTENDFIEIEETLINLHPYYKETRIEVFIDMIGDYLDYLLIQANSHEKHPNIPEINKYTWDYDENKKWYKNMFKMLIPRIKDNEYHFIKTPHKQVNLSRSVFRLNRILENRYINYINRLETCKGISKHDAKEFIYVMRVQEIVKHMLFWIFDLSAPIINKLTVSHRTWLYKYIYADDLGQFSKGVIKHLFSSTLSQGSANEGNDNDNIKSHTNLRELLSNFHTDPEITHNTEKALISAVDYVQGFPKAGFHEMYSIKNLEQLLFLEILSMVNSNIGIKRCKNCSKYFIVANQNIEYCNRIAQGEEKPCNMIGSKRTFEKKLKSERPLEIYNRAYKTHYARRKTGKMKECEFMIWAKEAKNNLDKVRAGKLDISEFEKWLKI